MKRSILVKLGAGVLAVLLCGCATLGKGPSDEELIAATIEQWSAGLAAQDADKVMATYSEDFESADMPDKDSMAELIEMAIDQGFLEDVEVIADEAETVIEGDTATFGPVELSGAMGSMMFDFELQKEAGAWLIVGTEGG